MHTIITTDVLKTMFAGELEDYRAAGEDFRRELTHAVMRDAFMCQQRYWQVRVFWCGDFRRTVSVW